MALFDAGHACEGSIFGSTLSPGLATLVFERPASHTLTSFGHVVLSFVSAYSVRIDMQPGGGGFLRLLHGQLEPIAYTGTVQGFVSMQAGDRVSYLSSLLEVATVKHFGVLQTEVDFQLVR